MGAGCVRVREKAMATQAKQTVGHVLIDIEDQRRQLYHRLEVNGVTVLVDGTPEDDPAIRQTIDLVLAAPGAQTIAFSARTALRGRYVQSASANTPKRRPRAAA